MLCLIDKGYYDYDYELIEKPKDFVDTEKSEEEVSSMLARFGIGQKRQDIKEMDAEQIQEYAMNN